MSPIERRAAYSLSGIFALRMLGLFLILPVFALYAEKLPGVTPMLVGLAIGIYGLFQAILQIPYGMLSDRIGRKPVMIAGMLIFAVGSVVAASAHDIYGIILGRALQGSGAIAAVVMATAADLSREQRRLRVMAIIGMSIGVAFSLSLILGPVINRWIGVPGIFWLTAVLALVGIAIVVFIVPTPAKTQFHRDAEVDPGQFRNVLSNPELLRLDFGIFALHLSLTSLFLSYPLALRDYGLASDHHWQVYLPVMLLSVIAMVPFVIIAETKHRMRQIFLGAIGGLMIGGCSLYLFHTGLVGLLGGLFIFFTAFNLLEATLPSLVAKMAPSERKGTAMGVYSSSQFFGAFAGGVMGGFMHTHFSNQGVFLFCAGVALVWILIAWGMTNPRQLSNFLLPVGEVKPEEADRLNKELKKVAGVVEAAVIAGDGVAYLKVDPEIFDERLLDGYSASQG